MKTGKIDRFFSVVLTIILSFAIIFVCFPLNSQAASSLQINSSVSMTSAYVGGTASLKATASGGTSPYTYKFLYKVGNSSWVTAKNYSSSASASISLSKAGTYTFRMYVKDKKNLEVYCDITSTIKEKYVALSNNSTISNTSVALGKSITVKGKASGGTSPYTYAYYYTPQDGSKKTVKSFSSASSADIKLPYAGYYTIQCAVKDKDGKTASKCFNVSVTSKTGSALANSSTVSSSSLSAGSSLKIYGKSSGGTQPCQYAYYYSTDGKNYTAISSYGKSSVCSYTPTSAGYYRFKVIAKDYSGTTASKILNVTVKKNTGVTLVNKSSITTSGNVEKGTTVIMNAAASGGTQPYKFAYYYKLNDGSWTCISSYSVQTSSSIKLSFAGTYSLKVAVRDEAGAVSNKTFTVKSLNGSTSGKTASVSVDYGVSCKLAADNITSGATYAFYYKSSSDSKYTQLSSYGNTSSVKFRPRYTGSYTVVAYTKTSSRTTSKVITVNSKISEYAKSELDRINAERKKAGVSPLVLDNDLTFAAGIRAEEIETSYSHTRPNGSSCFTVLSENCIKYRSSVGENIAYGYKDYNSVMDAWMKSQGHRDNILSANYKKVGIGINGKYWTQLFSD